jgi:hypothetical protein
MSVRVQVILDDAEQESFRHQAEKEGVSLSAWMREAARERLRGRRGSAPLDTAEQLTELFAACDQRERGVEPDWDEHAAAIETSRRSGASDT